ncbi:MAG: acylphosphatase [Candidatus Magasanikbacteria bacterium]|nr:acylphosphatase [Candidatus Magasanikbacteria bacterium]
MTKVLLKIYGKVQGVFFRDSAKQMADELGIVGYAKNLSDGTVEIEAEGEKEGLKRMVNWCKLGSRLAKVERVEEHWEEIPSMSKKRFEIL